MATSWNVCVYVYIYIYVCMFYLSCIINPADVSWMNRCVWVQPLWGASSVIRVNRSPSVNDSKSRVEFFSLVSLSRWRRRWNTATTSSAPRLWWRPCWSSSRSASDASLRTGEHTTEVTRASLPEDLCCDELCVSSDGISWIWPSFCCLWWESFWRRLKWALRFPSIPPSSVSWGSCASLAVSTLVYIHTR